jgi:hypothetical protein
MCKNNTTERRKGRGKQFENERMGYLQQRKSKKERRRRGSRSSIRQQKGNETQNTIQRGAVRYDSRRVTDTREEGAVEETKRKKQE